MFLRWFAPKPKIQEDFFKIFYQLDRAVEKAYTLELNVGALSEYYKLMEKAKFNSRMGNPAWEIRRLMMEQIER